MWALTLHYCLHKLHKLPHEIIHLPAEEQAFLMVSIAEKLKSDKKEIDKQRRNSKKRRR